MIEKINCFCQSLRKLSLFYIESYEDSVARAVNNLQDLILNYKNTGENIFLKNTSHINVQAFNCS